MKYSLPQPSHLFGCRLTARRLIPSLKWEAGRVKGGWLRTWKRRVRGRSEKLRLPGANDTDMR